MPSRFALDEGAEIEDVWRVASSPARPLHVLGLMAAILGVSALEYVPAMLASRETKAFCSGLAPGTALSEVRARASAAGLAASKLKERSWMLEHPHSIGRAWCVVHFDADARLSKVVTGD
jgi:hypothetical protein